MRRKWSVAVVACIIAMTGLVSQASAEPDCLPVKGKITNNAQPDGSTLGVVALNLDGEKSKCGIVGVPQYPSPQNPNFRHTVVCDNKVSSDEPQAQVTLNTYFISEPNYNYNEPCPENSFTEYPFSFEEISFADPNTARGAFVGVTADSKLIITGDFNCDGGIVMKFDGVMCFD